MADSKNIIIGSRGNPASLRKQVEQKVKAGWTVVRRNPVEAELKPPKKKRKSSSDKSDDESPD